MVNTQMAVQPQSVVTMFLCWFWSLHASVRSTFGKPADNKKTPPTTIILGKVPANDLGEAITFSDALERTLYGKFNYFVIVIVGVVLSNVLMETAGVAFYMPVSDCELELTNNRKGLLSAIGYVGMIISSHLWGFLADRIGRKRTMQPTMITAFVVTVVSSFATNFWSILVLRFINGICVSGASATIYAYLGELHSNRTRPRAMMVSSIIYSIGATIMPFIAFAVINREWTLSLPILGLTYKPWRLFLIVSGIPGLICGLIMFILPESPKYLLTVNREAEAKEVMQRIYRINGGIGKLELPHLLCEQDIFAADEVETKDLNNLGTFLKSMWNQTSALFGLHYIRATIIVCVSQFWFYFIGNGLYMWFPHIINAVSEFMKSHPGENKFLCQIVNEKHMASMDLNSANNSTFTDCPDKLEDATYLYSFSLELTYVISFIIISIIVHRVGNITIMFIIIVFSSASGFVAVLVPDVLIASIFYVLLFLIGVCINILSAATVEIYPTQLRAMALSVSLMMGRVGSVVGTNVVGSLLAEYCEASFYFTCFAMISCAILLLFLPRPTASKKTCDDAENHTH